MTKPSWIANIAFAQEPPFYGLEAADIFNADLVAFDLETFRFPAHHAETKGKKKMFVRRKAPRPVVATFAARASVPIPVPLRGGDDVGVRSEAKQWSALARPDAAAKALEILLADPGTVLVGANICYDLGVMAHKYPHLLKPIFLAIATRRVIDVQLREMLLLIHSGQMQDDDVWTATSLAELAKKYLQIDRSADKKGDDIWRLKYHTLDDVPLARWPAQAREYALNDATDTLQVAIAQAPIDFPVTNIDGLPATTAEGGVINECAQMRAWWALYLMGMWGMRVDAKVHEEWGQEIDKALRRAEAIARTAGFLRPDGSINQTVLRTLVEEDCRSRGVEPEYTPPSSKFPNGQLKIDSDTLKLCTATTMPWENFDGTIEQVQPLVEWGEASFNVRMRSTYFDVSALGIDHAMLYDFLVLVATGRTSGRSPNMQNPPRLGKFREQFIPRPGMVFCSCDYSALELRTLAQIHLWFMGSSTLAEAFRRGEDPHEIFGAKLVGMELSAFQAMKKTDKKYYKDMRQAAKGGNFGIPGGLGAKTMIDYVRDNYGVDLAKVAVISGWSDADLDSLDKVARADLETAYAKHLIRVYKQTWDEAGPYMDMIGKEVEAGLGGFAYVQPVSWRVRGGVGYCNGNNTGFQGLAADGAKEAAWRLAVLEYLGPEGLEVLAAQGAVWPEGLDLNALIAAAEDLHGVRSVLFIHDEIVTEGPADSAHRWAEAQAWLQVETMRVYTPDVPQIVEPALMRRWLKDAEPVRDDRGMLIPWERPQQ